MVDYWKSKTVLVTGGSGFLGSHLVEALKEKSCKNILIPRSQDYDLRIGQYAKILLEHSELDIIFNLAANVGGIGYNQAHPYHLFYDNALINLNLIHHAIHSKVEKFIQVGTVCAYPKWAPTPFSEESLWDGYPEETNAPYGLAKKMALVQLQAARDEFGFNGIYLLPTNLYGPRDEFSPNRSHVIPALIRKAIEAKETGSDKLVAWGTGNASRDFLFVRDAVEGIILAAEKYNRPEPLNLGAGKEVRIAALLYHICRIIGFDGQIEWDKSRPDGQPRRSLDTRKAKEALGWQARTSLVDGLRETIKWYRESAEAGKLYNEHSLMEEKMTT